MIQLDPRETIRIARQLVDSADTTTYYVQAVIKDLKTDDTIDTVNLTDRGSQRFSADWQVCADLSGNGRFITITTKVYTDSGYTTLSRLDGAGMDIYLVQKRVNAIGTLGGGGPDISYTKIRQIIQEEIKNLIPEQAETDLTPLSNKLNDLLDEIKSGFGKFNINEIILETNRKLGDIKQQIKSLPQPEKINFDSVLERINEIETTIYDLIDKNQSDLSEKINDNSGRIIQTNDKIKNEMIDKLESITELLKHPFTIIKKEDYTVVPASEPEKKQSSKFNLRNYISQNEKI